MFRLAPDADITGTCLGSNISISPVKLRQLFGEPYKSDGYKVSGEYTFLDSDDNVITLYDWKCTSLYDSSCPEPEDFWNDTKDAYFHIGAANKQIAETFANLLAAINKLEG